MHAMMLMWVHGAAGGLAALVIGGALGLLLCRAVAEWFRLTGDAALRPGMRALVPLAAAAGAAGLWWWEVVALGQVSAVGPAGPLQSELVLRSIAYLVLFWLLAAAT